MKVLAIAGSPRKQGNTAQLLREAIRGAEERGAEVELVYARDLALVGCIECRGCDPTGLCVVKDDMQALYPKLRTYERVIIAAPVFFAGVPAALKAIFDRCQACWVEKYRLKSFVTPRPAGRRALFLSACGWAKPTWKGIDMFAPSLAALDSFCTTLDIALSEKLLYRGIDDITPIDAHPEMLQEAFEAGKRLVEEA
jgi:multimeric flavodoxin WrbA